MTKQKSLILGSCTLIAVVKECQIGSLTDMKVYLPLNFYIAVSFDHKCFSGKTQVNTGRCHSSQWPVSKTAPGTPAARQPGPRGVSPLTVSGSVCVTETGRVLVRHSETRSQRYVASSLVCFSDHSLGAKLPRAAYQEAQGAETCGQQPVGG